MLLLVTGERFGVGVGGSVTNLGVEYGEECSLGFLPVLLEGLSKHE